MDTSNHYTMTTLFDQLGLPSSEESISEFIRNHKIPNGQKLEDASFWSPSQASFLKTAIEEDSDWAEMVDLLNNDLR